MLVERGHRHGLIAPSCIRLVDMRADRARGCAVERRCGTWPALILATVMPLTAAAGSAALAWPVRASNLEGTAMLLWWVCILVGNVMLGPVTRWTGVSSLRMLKLYGRLGLAVAFQKLREHRKQVLWLQRVKELKTQCEALREESNISVRPVATRMQPHTAGCQRAPASPTQTQMLVTPCRRRTR